MPSLSPRNGGELMSSIATVRELLRKDFSSEGQSAIADELSSVKQAKYQEKLRYETEIDIQKEMIQELNDKVERFKKEIEQERKIRKSLEATNAAMDEHKRDLAEKLESIQSSLDSQTQNGGDGSMAYSSLRKENENLKQENESMTSQLADAQTQKTEALHAAVGWEARCLASQRQVKELQNELNTSKRELQIHEERHSKQMEKHETTCDSFKKRLEESVAARQRAEMKLKTVATKPTLKETAETKEDSAVDSKEEISQLERRCKHAEEAKGKAEEKVVALEAQLESLRRGRSKAELRKELDTKKKVSKKVASLNVSFEKMSEHAEKMQKELEELAKDTSTGATQKIRKKKEALLLEKNKVGAILESVESQLKERLVVQKRKVEDTTSELERVQKDLKDSQQAVSDTTEDISKLEKRMAEMVKAVNNTGTSVSATAQTEKSTTTTTASAPKKVQKKKVVAGKAKVPAKKRQLNTETADEGGKRRRKGK